MAKRSDSGTIAICRYLVKKGKERQMEALLSRHHDVMVKAGLAARTPHLVLRGRDDKGRTFYLEILPWKNAQAANKAHQDASVMAIWEPMGAVCELMEFPHAELLPTRKRPAAARRAARTRASAARTRAATARKPSRKPAARTKRRAR
jgi:hypothetical protein